MSELIVYTQIDNWGPYLATEEAFLVMLYWCLRGSCIYNNGGNLYGVLLGMIPLPSPLPGLNLTFQYRWNKARWIRYVAKKEKIAAISHLLIF